MEDELGEWRYGLMSSWISPLINLNLPAVSGVCPIIDVPLGTISSQMCALLNEPPFH